MRGITEYDPFDQQDPVHDLTLLIRGLRMGDGIKMPDGTLVKSTSVHHGSSMQRRFSVIPPEDKSTPEERHKAHVLNRSTFRQAETAAKKALNKE